MKKYHELYNLFSQSNEALYWQGFILADGYINHETKRLVFELAPKDLDQVNKLAKFINFDNKNKPIIRIQDKMHVDSLIKILRVKPRKSFTGFTLNKRLSLESKLKIYIGFIDGDGCIDKQSNRFDCKLRIKLHESSLKFLKQLEKDIYQYFNFEYKNLTKINSSGYAQLTISNNTLLRKLKRFVIKHKLPILERKWNIININEKSQYIKASETYKLVKSEIKNGLKFNEICKKHNLNYQTVYKYFYRRGESIHV